MNHHPILFTAALATGLATAAATSQNREVELEWIRNAGGRLDGVIAGNFAGRGLAGAGDVNGDGADDVLVAAWDTGFFDPPGTVYLVYGAELAFPETQSLGAADVTINGIQNGDRTGTSLAGVGDVNGDGFDDVLIGQPRYDAPGETDSGRAYLVWGGPALPAVIDLGALGSQGVVFEGVDFSDLTGQSVAGPGDVNGDGVPDLLIGAEGASPGGKNLAGSAYIVYGSASFPSLFDLSTLTPATGVVINGIDASDHLGVFASAAGDVNGDGFMDVAVAADEANPGGRNDAGEVYVVYGGASLPGTIELATLGSAGLAVRGEVAGDRLGSSVGGGGDVNGDGFDDIVAGADQFDDSGPDSNEGRVYVVWGGASLPGVIETSTLGSQGIVLTGADPQDCAGMACAMGGDMNRDGFADLVIGSPNADPGGTANAGETYLLHGGTGLPAAIDLGAVGALGVQINGIDAQDRAGANLAFVGDVDADGFDDSAVGARFADNGAGSDAGEVTVVKGACHVLQAQGAVAEGQTFTMASHGLPNKLYAIFASAFVLPAPVQTSKGPFWLDLPVQLPVLPLDAMGESLIPLEVPAGMGLAGLTVYWQTVQQPAGFNCDSSNLLITTIE